MKKNRIIALASALAIIITASVIAAIAINRPVSSGGSYYRDIVDRVSFYVENTEFRLQKANSGEYQIDFSFSAKKTEPDFYAVINSIDVESISYKSLIFENTSGDDYTPENAVIPAENGKTKEISWDIKMTFSDAISENTEFYLVIDYVSGMTADTSDEHLLRIPMEIVFG